MKKLKKLNIIEKLEGIIFSYKNKESYKKNINRFCFQFLGKLNNHKFDFNIQNRKIIYKFLIENKINFIPFIEDMEFKDNVNYIKFETKRIKDFISVYKDKKDFFYQLEYCKTVLDAYEIKNNIPLTYSRIINPYENLRNPITFVRDFHEIQYESKLEFFKPIFNIRFLSHFLKKTYNLNFLFFSEEINNFFATYCNFYYFLIDKIKKRNLKVDKDSYLFLKFLDTKRNIFESELNFFKKNKGISVSEEQYYEMLNDDDKIFFQIIYGKTIDIKSKELELTKFSQEIIIRNTEKEIIILEKILNKKINKKKVEYIEKVDYLEMEDMNIEGMELYDKVYDDVEEIDESFFEKEKLYIKEELPDNVLYKISKEDKIALKNIKNFDKFRELIEENVIQKNEDNKQIESKLEDEINIIEKEIEKLKNEEIFEIKFKVKDLEFIKQVSMQPENFVQDDDGIDGDPDFLMDIDNYIRNEENDLEKFKVFIKVEKKLEEDIESKEKFIEISNLIEQQENKENKQSSIKYRVKNLDFILNCTTEPDKFVQDENGLDLEDDDLLDIDNYIRNNEDIMEKFIYLENDTNINEEIQEIKEVKEDENYYILLKDNEFSQMLEDKTHIKYGEEGLELDFDLMQELNDYINDENELKEKYGNYVNKEVKEIKIENNKIEDEISKTETYFILLKENEFSDMIEDKTHIKIGDEGLELDFESMQELNDFINDEEELKNKYQNFFNKNTIKNKEDIKEIKKEEEIKFSHEAMDNYIMVKNLVDREYSLIEINKEFIFEDFEVFNVDQIIEGIIYEIPGDGFCAYWCIDKILEVNRIKKINFLSRFRSWITNVELAFYCEYIDLKFNLVIYDEDMIEIYIRNTFFKYIVLYKTKYHYEIIKKDKEVFMNFNYKEVFYLNDAVEKYRNREDIIIKKEKQKIKL